MEEKQKSEAGIKLVATGGIFILVALLILGMGVFGVRLMWAVASMPAPVVEKAAAAALVTAAAPAGEVASVATGAVVAVAEEDPVKAELMKVGRTVYMQCAACHGPAGQSLIPAMAPNLTGSPVVNGSTERMVAMVLNGIQPEGRFQGVMIPWKAMLTDEQIAGVLTYIRASFGNDSPPITPGMVGYARSKHGGMVGSPRREELDVLTGELPEG